MTSENKSLIEKFDNIEKALQEPLIGKKIKIDQSEKNQLQILSKNHLIHNYSIMKDLSWSDKTKKKSEHEIFDEEELLIRFEDTLRSYFECEFISFEYRILEDRDSFAHSVLKLCSIFIKLNDNASNPLEVHHAMMQVYGSKLYLELTCLGEQRFFYSQFLFLKKAIHKDNQDFMKIHIDEEQANTKITIVLEKNNDGPRGVQK